MAKGKQNELIDLSIPELKAKAKELNREIFELKNELAMQRKLEKPHLIKEKKKNRARILTVLTMKEAAV